MSTLESELDEPTVPTTWTPDSSPGGALKGDATIRTLSTDSERQQESIELTRTGTFGEKEMGDEEKWGVYSTPHGHVPGRNSVGVAF